MKTRIIIKEYDAVGGPETTLMGSDGFQMGATDKGTYRIAYCSQHSSRRYPQWSKIKWGSEIKEVNGTLMIKHKGKWSQLKNLSTVTRQDILDYYEALYGDRKLPKKWVFNDFGHMTCYLYKDKNKNKKFDRGKEKIHGEFFHTTPVNEAQTARGEPVILDESHGCIHIKPNDIDELIKHRYMRRGAKVVIHGYDKKVLPFKKGLSGKAPYEIHFLPGMKKVYVVGWQ